MTYDEKKERALLAGLAVLAAEPVPADLNDAVEGWLTIFGALAETLPPQPAPEGSWERLEARLPPGGELRTMVGVVDGPWEPVGPGVSRRVLLRAPDGEPLAFLLRVEAGGRVLAHPHDRREECMLIQGDVRIADADLLPGDFLVAEAGSTHAEMTTRGGMLAYIRYLDLPAAA